MVISTDKTQNLSYLPDLVTCRHVRTFGLVRLAILDTLQSSEKRFFFGKTIIIPILICNFGYQICLLDKNNFCSLFPETIFIWEQF